LNFAVGGAWTSARNNDSTIDGWTGLTSQIDSFARRVKDGRARFNADTTLFFIAIGLNDVLFGSIGGPESRALVASAGQNVEKATRALHAAGGRHIAIATVPTASLTPQAGALLPGQIKAIGEAAASLNTAYQQLAGKLRTDLKADVFTLPWGQHFDEVFTNPAAFGLASAPPCLTRGAMAEGQSVCPDPQRLVFFDSLHPTTATHRVVGYRLATQGWPHFTCPANLRMGAVSEHPACRFLSSANGVLAETSIPAPAPSPDQMSPARPASPPARAAAANACTHLEFRQTADLCNNCTSPPWNGELMRASGQDWTGTYVDGHGRRRSVRLRVVAESKSELVFFDRERNLQTRFDLVARKGLQRRTNEESWVGTADIVGTDCR
jgi:hypothetical protein